MLARPPLPLEWTSFPPVVTAKSITTKGAESPDSRPIGVIGALVCFFHLRPSRTNLNFTLPSRPGSALRHWEVSDCPEVADSVDARTCPQKTADIDATPWWPSLRMWACPYVTVSLCSSYVRLGTRTSSGRVASGGASAQEPPRATCSQPDSIRTVEENGCFFFALFPPIPPPLLFPFPPFFLGPPTFSPTFAQIPHNILFCHSHIPHIGL